MVGAARQAFVFRQSPDFRSLENVRNEQFDVLVRNVYKVLLTRGIVGSVIYSPVPSLRDRG